MIYDKFKSRLELITGEKRFTYLPLLLLVIMALILGLLVTQSGMGLSPDSMNYLNVGESLFLGNGFYITLSGGHQAYTVQPPLYPIIISILMHFGTDAEQSAKLISILSLAFLMIPLFLIGKNACNQFTGFLTCIMCLSLTPLLKVTLYAWTEISYILFTAFSILFLIKFTLRTRSKNQMLYLAAIFASLSVLTRYIGLTLIITGLITIIINYRSNIKEIIRKTVVFGLISIMPISIWIYRNYILTSQLSGGNRGGVKDTFIVNAITLKTTLINDLSLAFFVFIAISLALMAYLILSKKNQFQKYLKKNYIIILYISIYTGTLLIIKTLWAFDPIDDRLLTPIYPFLILVVVSLLIYGFYKIKRFKSILFIILAIVLSLFFIYQASNSINFFGNPQNGIDSSYNAVNWKDYKSLTWIRDNVSLNSTIYSNYANGVSFRVDRTVQPLNENELSKQLKDINNSFIICFKTNNSFIVSNEEIGRINNKYNLLTVKANFPEATIYKTKK